MDPPRNGPRWIFVSRRRSLVDFNVMLRHWIIGLIPPKPTVAIGDYQIILEANVVDIDIGDSCLQLPDKGVPVVGV